MRQFELMRIEDETGISGTGKVAEGVQFSNGWCVMVWCTPKTEPTLGFYAKMEDLKAVHGHGGRTIVNYPTEFCRAFWRDAPTTHQCMREPGHADNNHFDAQTGASWSGMEAVGPGTWAPAIRLGGANE